MMFLLIAIFAASSSHARTHEAATELVLLRNNLLALEQKMPKKMATNIITPAALQDTKKILKPTQQTTESVPASEKPTLLDEIRKGKKLKPAPAQEPKPAAEQPAPNKITEAFESARKQFGHNIQKVPTKRNSEPEEEWETD